MRQNCCRIHKRYAHITMAQVFKKKTKNDQEFGSSLLEKTNCPDTSRYIRIRPDTSRYVLIHLFLNVSWCIWMYRDVSECIGLIFGGQISSRYIQIHSDTSRYVLIHQYFVTNEFNSKNWKLYCFTLRTSLFWQSVKTQRHEQLANYDSLSVPRAAM